MNSQIDEEMPYSVVESEIVVDNSDLKSINNNNNNIMNNNNNKINNINNNNNKSNTSFKKLIIQQQIKKNLNNNNNNNNNIKEENKEKINEKQIIIHNINNNKNNNIIEKNNFILIQPQPLYTEINNNNNNNNNDSQHSNNNIIINNNINNNNNNIINNNNNNNNNNNIIEHGNCLVCGDRGSGYHYSTFSCEGCKGFFKRTIQKSISYNCRETEQCQINRKTRNNCQFCRFKKCLQVGMKKEAVREDRTPGGRQKNYKKAKFEGTNYTHLEEQIHLLTSARADLMPSLEDLPPDQSINSNSIFLAENLVQFGYVELRLIIDWARRVPGFGDLILEDQIALLKSSFMELNVLRLAFRSLDCPFPAVKFTKGLEIPLEKTLSMKLGKDLVRLVVEFISRLRHTQIDLAEFSILSAVVLTFPDASNLTDKQSVITLQNKLLDCLQHYTTTCYQQEPRRYGRLLLRLPLLRTISAHAAEMFLSLSLEGNGKMNSLVLEMMDKM